MIYVGVMWESIDGFQLSFDFDGMNEKNNSQYVFNELWEINSQINSDVVDVIDNKKIASLEKLALLDEDYAEIFDMCKAIPVLLWDDYIYQGSRIKDYLRGQKTNHKGFVSNFSAWTVNVAKEHNQKILSWYNILYTLFLSFVKNIIESYKAEKWISHIVGQNIDEDDFQDFRRKVLSDKDNKYLLDIKEKMKKLYIKCLAKWVDSRYLIKDDSNDKNFYETNDVVPFRDILLEEKHKFERYSKNMKDKYKFANIENMNSSFEWFLKIVKENLPKEILDKVYFSAKDKVGLDFILNQIFLKFNNGLQYPYKGIRYKNIKSLFIDRFYILYLPKERKYEQHIINADKAFSSRDWQKAKLEYIKACDIKPNEEYPTNKIQKIDEILSK